MYMKKAKEKISANICSWNIDYVDAQHVKFLLGW